MSYLEAVIWLLSWPVLIFATFQLIKYILKRVDYL